MGLYTIVGPLLAIMGLGLMMNYGRMMKMREEMMDSKGMMFLMGLLSVLFGLILINNITPTGWETWVLYILGWLGLVKGIFINLFPKMIKKMGTSIMRGNTMFIQSWLFLITLFGLWMTWMAYMG